eukprot:PITA_22913
MWKRLKDLYQNNNNQRKLALKDKLRKIKCEKSDTISTYLNKLTTCRDELGSVGITTVDDDMEEIRRSTRDGSSSKQDDEENIALVSKARKAKGKASHSKSGSSHGGKKIDKLKVQCFHCHEVGHYATNCPQKKSKKDSSKGSDGEGTFVFQREHGAPLTLTDVKCVPGLKKNLVSVTMLEDKDYDVVFSKGKNRSPHCILGMKTPMEDYSEKRPDVSHFRIFGTSICFHVTKDAKKKLDPIVELGILVGYTDTPHNYWVYLPSTQRIVVCKDLRFDEEKAMRVSL